MKGRHYGGRDLNQHWHDARIIRDSDMDSESLAKGINVILAVSAFMGLVTFIFS